MATPHQEPPPPPADTSPDHYHNRPVRVLVQTKTHLVPGDKSTDFGERFTRMENLISQHVWQRDYDRHRERTWNYHVELAMDNVECWFLVDHHGLGPVYETDPLVLWYKWTGAEFVKVEDRPPGRVRREMRYYPFERFGQYPERPRRPRKVLSAAEELRRQREHLRSTLSKGFCLVEWHLRFVKEHPGHAEWIKARVPAEAWARLDDPLESVIIGEPVPARIGERRIVSLGSLRECPGN